MTDAGPQANSPATQRALETGRCHACGYPLNGLPVPGACPECGIGYTHESAQRLRPWPSALAICCRLGWPIAGLVLAGLLVASASRSEQLAITGLGLGYSMVVAIALNSYLQVRFMLRRSLPETVRTRGPVAILRAIGRTICVLLLLVFVGVPLILGVTCLVVLTQNL